MTAEEAITIITGAQTMVLNRDPDKFVAAIDRALISLRLEGLRINPKMTDKRVNEILILCNSINAVAGAYRLKGDTQAASILERAQGTIMELLRLHENTQDPNEDNPKPLTIEELKQMKGEPVWMVWPDGRIKSQWWLVGNHEWNVMEFDDPVMEQRYGKTWICYNHKPKEDAK